MPHCARTDLLLRIQRADTRQQIAEREDALHHCSGIPKVPAISAMLRPSGDQPRISFPLGHFVGIAPRDILDQRGFERGGIVAFFEDRAGQRLGLALLARDQTWSQP
jgi:hypothetical protein